MKFSNSLCLLFFVTILGGLVCTASASEAVSHDRGRVTTGINLRAAPGLDGKIITGLDTGTVVTITGEQSGWYQIAYEDEAYGYRGWVYGKYVEKLAAPPAPVTALPAPAETHQPVTENVSPPAPATTAAPKTPAVEAPGQPVKMPANTIEQIQAAAVTQPPPAHGLSSSAPPAPPARTPVPAVENKEPAPAHPANTVSESQRIATHRPQATAGPGTVGLLSVVLKIASVFLSCLALMISYRTFQLVTTAGRTT